MDWRRYDSHCCVALDAVAAAVCAQVYVIALVLLAVEIVVVILPVALKVTPMSYLHHVAPSRDAGPMHASAHRDPASRLLRWGRCCWASPPSLSRLSPSLSHTRVLAVFPRFVVLRR